MRTAALLVLAAAPGVAAGYLVLLAYLLRRVKPLPITFLPEFEHEPAAGYREPAKREPVAA